MWNPFPWARGRTVAGLAALAVVAACGGDDDPPVTGDIEGLWTYEISNAEGAGSSCDVTDVTLEFTRTSAGLEGTWEAGGNGNIDCTFSNGGSQSLNFGPDVGAIAGLSADDTNMSFAFNTTMGEWSSTGTFMEDGNVMGGQATMYLTSGGNLVELNGTWRAERD